MGDCCHGTAKGILVVFNIIFLILGIALLALGLTLLLSADLKNVIALSDVTFYNTGCYVLISVGAVSIVVGFQGCCGALKENRCLLGSYILFLLILFIVQLVVGILVFVEHEKIEDAILQGFNETAPVSFDDANAEAVKSMQQVFKCCGLSTGCGDWTNGNTTGCGCDPLADPSVSCATSSGCTNGDDPGQPIYTTSCYNSTVGFVQKNIVVIGGVAMGVAGVQLLGLFLAVCVCCNLRKGQYEAY